jgi:hypothetical protein
MTQARSSYGFRLTTLTSLLLLSAIALAKPAGPDAVGRLSASASGVQWMTSANNEKVTLTVMTPDGKTFRKDFMAGTTPSFRLQDLGEKFVDGTYSYELRVTPRISASVRSELAAARDANDNDSIVRIQRNAGIADAIVQSGSLMVVNGAFVNSDASEPPASVMRLKESATSAGTVNASVNAPKIRPLDVVTADDAIIQGSLCVGLDCVNNESFGFDTIRLKENNDRIVFVDTSTSAGFPTHDWQLTANDSASGGAEKFSIEDLTAATVPLTVTGSAPTNSIFVASNGKVGFRTSTPGLDLHISTGDTPAIRQEQTSASGFTAQTWDIGANEANWFVRDVTGGSRLPLRIRPGAPTSSIDIAASGFVGIGTASPTTNLHVFAGATTDATFTIGTATSGPGLNISYNGANFGRSSASINVRPDALAVAPNPSLRFFTADVQRMIIDNEGFIGIGTIANPAFPIEASSGAKLTVGGVWTDASSREFKQDICDLTSNEALDALRVMTPVRYAYKADPAEHHVGFIAEDVPDLVAAADRKSLAPMDVVAVLAKVVKDQQATIDALTRRLEQVEKKQ